MRYSFGVLLSSSCHVAHHPNKVWRDLLELTNQQVMPSAQYAPDALTTRAPTGTTGVIVIDMQEPLVIVLRELATCGQHLV
jgi:hypothetical protein